MKILYIVRGLPGSGKSTFAKSLGCPHFEADMYFMRDGVYNFQFNKLKEAHDWCYKKVENAMTSGEDKIAVSNTFTTEKEMAGYISLASEHNYQTFVLIVENRHGGVNVHDVPDETLLKMQKRFNIKL
jgi:predicted kinase